MKNCFCILTVAHPFDDVRVYRKMALSIVKELDVIWIGPDFHFFESKLNEDGIHWDLYKNRKGLTGRVLNNFTAIRQFRKYRKSISFVYIPDPDMAFFFTLFVRTRRIRKIFDIHEVYHKYLLQHHVGGIISKFLNNILQKVINRTVSNVDLTIAVSGTVSDYYVSGANRNLVIRNCLPLSFADIKENSVSDKKSFTVVHGKNHPTRGTMYILEAIRILKEKRINFKVLMINTKSEVFDEYVKKYELESYIDLHDGLPFTEMLNQMHRCHAGLIAYGRDLGVDSLPNRIFEYMALGLPVIVPWYSTEMFKIVEKEKCGLVTDTEDPAKIAECIEELAGNFQLSKEMGERGRKAFLKQHNWEAEIMPFIEYLKNQK